MHGVATNGASGAHVEPPGQGGASGRCLVCGGSLAASPLPGLTRCQLCAFVTADTALSDGDLVALYGRDYFHGTEYHDYVEERESLRLNFSRRLRTLDSLAAGLRGKSLLEIGCAYGFFLELAAEYGLRAIGVDIAQDGIRYARERLRVDARLGDYLDLSTGPVDIVCMWDTVEHLSRPDLFVTKAAQDLVPGGLLAVTTGDIGSVNARVRGARWRMIHPPTHLHYFTVGTLSSLLRRNGFEVVHVSHPGVSRRLHAILYMVLAQRLGARRLHRIATRMTPNLPITLNLGDIMFVVARKSAPAQARA
jgi:SAM-dependent methyltransferase